MKLSQIAIGAGITLIVLFVAGFGLVFLLHSREMMSDLSSEFSPKSSSDSSAGGSDAAVPLPVPTSDIASASASIPGFYKQFIYGRVTTTGDVVYEGRLRFGGHEEAFWGDYFNGAKEENTWLAHVPPERRVKRRQPISILGLTIAHRDRELEYGRNFMARFGDIARIDAQDKDVRVTLKSGSSYLLDGFSFGDFDDGVRVWDKSHGEIAIDRGQLRAIELLPTPELENLPSRLHGTVKTAQGEFAGFIQWDREECLGPDLLSGFEGQSNVDLRFDSIRSIAKHAPNGSLVTTNDGREIVLTGTNDVNNENRGIYVDDSRYGRVLVTWEGFERVDFTPSSSGPQYGDFPAGSLLTGRVSMRSGKSLAGKLVYDLDESETTHTFDAPFNGVDYTIPFGLIAAIELPAGDDPNAKEALVTLHSGEVLKVERTGDVGEWNAGALVFVEGQERPEYVPWSDIARVDLDRPPAMYPPIGGQ